MYKTLNRILLINILFIFTFIFQMPNALSFSFEGIIENNLYARKYILGPNDVISIDVYDNPEFRQENIRIQPDGDITLHPLGTLNVSGMTIDKLKELLIEKYKFYLNNPEVTIKLEKSKPFIAYITGAVLRPGSYEITTDSNIYHTTSNETIVERRTPLLTNVLVAAGGLSFDADIENIVIKNNNDNSEIKVNLLDLLENGNTNQDILLISGDSIYIPKLSTPLALSEEKYKKYAAASFSPHNIPIKVFGYVNNPGLISLDSSQSLNLNSAITSAGGYLKDSAYAPKKVFISRADISGKLVTRAVNPMSEDITLMPNDIIYVPEKPRPLGGKIFDYLVKVLAPVNLFANSYNNWALMFDPQRFNTTVAR